MTTTRGSLLRPDMVLIDLDGTLVDTVPDLAHATDIMMTELGMPLRGEQRVRQWIGNGVERLVRRALIDDVDGEPDEELFRRAYPIFMRAYEDNICNLSQVYPGVREGLAFLRESRYRVGCVTNKAARFTEPLLQGIGLFDEFEIIVSGDTLPVKKPDPAPLLHAASRLGVAPERSLMIGDSISDVKAARAAGFGIICVPYGYNHGRDIRDAGPDAVIESFAELRDLLEADGSGSGARRLGNDA